MFIFIHIFTNIQYDFRVLGKLLYVQAFIYIFIYLFYLMQHMAAGQFAASLLLRKVLY